MARSAELSPAALARVQDGAAPVGLCQFGNIHTRMPFMDGAGVTNVATYLTVFTAETAFDYIRLVYTNQNSSGYAVAAIAVAPSSALGNAVDPTNAAGAADATLWSIVFCNNGGADGDPPSPSGASRGLSVPAGVGTDPQIAVGVAVTDWVNVGSLTPTDGNYPYLFVRTYMSVAAAGGVMRPVPFLQTPAGGGSWDPYAAGRVVRSHSVPSDVATSPNVLTPARSTSSILMPSGVQFMQRERGLAVLSFGDSLYAGAGTASQQNDPFQIACNSLSTPSIPITAAKFARSSQQSLYFQLNAMAVTGLFKPDVVFFKPESPNDFNTSFAGFQLSFERAMAYCEYCTRQGCVPVISTAEPWTYTGAVEAARIQLNTLIRASGYLVFDMDAVLTDNGNPARILAQYNSPTASPHYSDAGSAALALPIEVILQRVMAARPR